MWDMSFHCGLLQIKKKVSKLLTYKCLSRNKNPYVSDPRFWSLSCNLGELCDIVLNVFLMGFHGELVIEFLKGGWHEDTVVCWPAHSVLSGPVRFLFWVHIVKDPSEVESQIWG